MARGLGFARQQSPGGPPSGYPARGYETPEEFRQRKQRETQEQQRQQQQRERAAQQQRAQDPYGNVTVGPDGVARWKYDRPMIGARVFDDAIRTLNNIPGPHQRITDPYVAAADAIQGGGGGPPSSDPAAARGRGRPPGSKWTQEQKIAQSQRMREKTPERTSSYNSSDAAFRGRRAKMHNRIINLRNEYFNARTTPERKQQILGEMDQVMREIAQLESDFGGRR